MCKHSCFATVLAVVVGIVVLTLLSYSFAISTGLPTAQKAAPLATIATGIALSLVAVLAYLLQLRSLDLHDRGLDLQDQSFNALHEPSLGIHYKNPYRNPTMLPGRETATKEKIDVYAEYIIWNAGDVPILMWQPQCPRPLGLGPVDPDKEPVDPDKEERIELERGRGGGGKRVFEESFPIVLGKGEVCIWRQFTGDVAPCRPLMSEIITDSREEARELLQKQKGNRRFLFEVVYFSKPPATLRKSDERQQYVAFSYTVPIKKAPAR